MSFVGNAYWAGSTATSSDPAAASCTQVPIMVDSNNDNNGKHYDYDLTKMSLTKR